MSVRVGNLRFLDWQSLELSGGWSDTFIFRMLPSDGLPPGDYARVVSSLAVPLRQLRPHASLWVQVCSPQSPKRRRRRVQGSREEAFFACPAREEAGWFREEVRYALRGVRVPVAVTGGSIPPQPWDFSFFPRLDSRPYPRPPYADPYINEGAFKPSLLACLRILARSDCAYTAEIASLAGLSRTGARAALSDLQARRQVALDTSGKIPFWKLRRAGLSLALRSWGLPPGMTVRGRKERGRDACSERLSRVHQRGEFARSFEKVAIGDGKFGFRRKEQGVPGSVARRSPSGRHRRTARLWPAWLRSALPQARVWAGWSEVACGRTRPDALCWGCLAGVESLFWLEVESGHHSRERLQHRTVERVNHALNFARRCPVHLVFALLGPPWVLESAVRIFQEVPDDLAVVLEDWKAFGSLPGPEWGRVRGG